MEEAIVSLKLKKKLFRAFTLQKTIGKIAFSPKFKRNLFCIFIKNLKNYSIPPPYILHFSGISFFFKDYTLNTINVYTLISVLEKSRPIFKKSVNLDCTLNILPFWCIFPKFPMRRSDFPVLFQRNYITLIINLL